MLRVDSSLPDSSPSAEELLAWTAARFAPRAVFTTGFGIEGCVIVSIIGGRRLPIDVVTLDTGLLFPETYALWRTLEERYGVAIRGIEPERTVAEQAEVEGERLWERGPDRCCELRKVRPLARALEGYDAWVTAIRRDQTPDRAAAPRVSRDERFGLVKVNPLADWSAADVRSYAAENDVPYSPLHDRGYPSIGCVPCTTPVAAGEDPRAGRWRGAAKTECGLHARAVGSAASQT